MSDPDLRARLMPSRTELIDVGFGVVLSIVAVLGFRSTFAGNEEILVGVPAVLLGAVVAIVLTRLRVELLVGAAASALVFVLASGPMAIRSEALLGFIPTLGVLRGVADGLISGWMRLLTSVPPAGEAGNLLAVPYAVGYFGAIITLATAMRWSRQAWSVAVPTAILALTFLFGTRQPVSVLLHGVLFGVVAIAWLSVRESRRRTITIGTVDRRRTMMAVALLAAVAVVAAGVGPVLPGAGASPRFILRERIDPPFDPLSEPSPLVGYRRYTGPDVEDEPVMTVRGLPDGTPVRLAVLDDYDGLVWRATGDGSRLSGRFSRVGETIPDPVDGTEVEVEVTITRPHGSWLPLIGDVVGVDLGPTSRDEQLRFNTETETGAVPGGLAAGETYIVRAVLPLASTETELAGRAIDPQYGEYREDMPAELVEIAASLRGSAQSPYAKVEAIANALREDGAFSDGGPDATVATPPGHSLARIARFLGAPQQVGNGEQYAAALALLARADGVPARVVMGFRPEERGDEITIYGRDVQAWVEIPLADAGWVAIHATPPEDELPNPSRKPRPRPLNPEPQPPPPPADPPAAALPQALDASDTELEVNGDPEAAERRLSPVTIALGGSVLLVGFAMASVILLKSRRRTRRRTRGTGRQRANGGWVELLDTAVDLGRPMIPKATRRESAIALATASAPNVADDADTLTFGATDPTDEDVDRMWAAVDAVIADLSSSATVVERLKAKVSISSLRRSR